MGDRSTQAMRYVYFIKSPRLRAVKIGIANDPRKRLSYLQVGSADRLELVGTWLSNNAAKLEGVLHRHFSSDRIGGEWFTLTPALREIMEGLAGPNDSGAVIVEIK